MSRSKTLRWLVALVAAALLLGACASESGGGGSEGADGEDNVQPIVAGWANAVDPTPTTGGTLNVTLPTPPTGLDPNSGTLGLTTQGPIFTAVYDSLLQYDIESGEITGRLAEGITSNDDFTEWTLKLRSGVTFSDGTPLNAEAVKFSIDRIKGARNAAASYPAYFSSVETPDELTVVLKLSEPLNNVDALFTTELGYVVSPTAAQAAGADFARNPVGAGPFKVQSFNPDSELVLVKNPTFALGDVALDEIRMTWSSDQGANLDKVTTGQSDMAFLTSIPLIARAVDGGTPVYSAPVSGAGFAINSAEGRAFPGNDPRIRQALSMAANPELMNERANEGRGVAGRWLFPPGYRFYVDTPYSVGDTDQARQLVEQVKAETGWDGSLTLVTPPPEDQALAYQAQLNAVGFNVTVEPMASFSQLIERVLLNRDFDLSIWTLSSFETNVYQVLARSLQSTSPNNYASFKSPEFDALLTELRAAPDDDATKDVLDRIAELWQTEQPFFLATQQGNSAIMGKNVAGLVTTSNGVFFWNEVFKA